MLLTVYKTFKSAGGARQRNNDWQNVTPQIHKHTLKIYPNHNHWSAAERGGAEGEPDGLEV